MEIPASKSEPNSRTQSFLPSVTRIGIPPTARATSRGTKQVNRGRWRYLRIRCEAMASAVTIAMYVSREVESRNLAGIASCGDMKCASLCDVRLLGFLHQPLDSGQVKAQCHSRATVTLYAVTEVT